MLVNAPLVDQLAESTLDGQPDENARANCVPASLTSGVRALVPGAVVDGDALKDAVYGQGYTGATDPARFAAYLAAHYGVTLTRAPGSGTASGAALVSTIIAGLERHQPVTGAIPSQWSQVPPDPLNPVGGTHEVLFCDYDAAAGTLTAMNPWPEPPTNNAFYQTEPVAWWQARLVYGRVFTLAREADMAFIRQPDGSARDDQTGVVLHLGMAAYVLANDTSEHALMGETYYDEANSFVPLTGGLVLSYNKGENVVRADRAGETLQAVWQQLVAARAAGGDPAGQAAIALLAKVRADLAAA